MEDDKSSNNLLRTFKLLSSHYSNYWIFVSLKIIGNEDGLKTVVFDLIENYDDDSESAMSFENQT